MASKRGVNIDIDDELEIDVVDDEDPFEGLESIRED